MTFKSNSTTAINSSAGLSSTSLEVDVSGGVIGVISGGFQGEISGFVLGGGDTPGGYSTYDTFSFSSDSIAAVSRSLSAQGTYPSTSLSNGASQKSSVNGYFSGGSSNINSSPVGSSLSNIGKFPFAVSNTYMNSVGSLTLGRSRCAGQSSTTHGYTTGGRAPVVPSPPSEVNTIDKFPFASDENASLVGGLSISRSFSRSGHSSSTHGYMSGGYTQHPSLPANSTTNIIDRFPFASDSDATDVGDLTTIGSYIGQGISSTVSGYRVGGSSGPPGSSNVIQKFPFATNTNATSVGSLTRSLRDSSSHSGFSHGYISAGDDRFTFTSSNVLEKFPFAVDSNSSDVGDLATVRTRAHGIQF